MKFLSFFTAFFLLSSVSAQKTITVINKLSTTKSFTYRVIKQEYITNENNFFLDVYNDTNYLKFLELRPLVYEMKMYRDELCAIPYDGIDTTKKMRFVWEFTDSGDVKTLLNYRDFSSILSASEEAKYRNKLIDLKSLKASKELFKDPLYVANAINADYIHMFRIAGDTFNEAYVYLQMRNVPSPINQSILPIMGNIKIETISEPSQIFGVHAQNKAEASEKQILKQQLLDYIKIQDQAKIDQRKEITKIGLNAEQDWVYNSINQRFSKITLSDVFVINMQSRGNIRIFDLWEIKERTD
ncbi:MAG: hypothetical protein P8O20_04270 [Bacteroidia bacterium]|nr:hypothetical protein [Bacteroidia bacterium]